MIKEKTEVRNYETLMNNIWEVKEEIFREIKQIGLENYFDYLENNLIEVKKRFSNHYTNIEIGSIKEILISDTKP
jgi:hypothetical protein